MAGAASPGMSSLPGTSCRLPGLGRLAPGEQEPRPRDCELGWTLGMNSEYADVVKLSEREATGLGNMNVILSILDGGKEDFEKTG